MRFLAGVFTALVCAIAQRGSAQSSTTTFVDRCITPVAGTTYASGISVSEDFLISFVYLALPRDQQERVYSEMWRINFDGVVQFGMAVNPDSRGRLYAYIRDDVVADGNVQVLDGAYEIKLRGYGQTSLLYADDILIENVTISFNHSELIGGVLLSDLDATATPGQFCGLRIQDLSGGAVLDCANTGSPDFYYDAFCCVSDACGVDQGGCSSDDHCSGDLVCGSTGSCDSGFFPDDARCCVESCGDGACGANEGLCSADGQCAGDLVCGSAGSCDPALFGDDTRCCVDLCAAYEHADWTFEASCCASGLATDGRLCPGDAGGCSGDDQCVGDLVCGDGTCPLGVGFPATGARCCSECPFGIDDNLEVRYPPLIDDDNTRVVLTATRSDFTVRMLVPHQYTAARFDFEGATNDAGAFDSDNLAANQYWTIDADSDPCYTIYTADIPWDLFRTTHGGMVEMRFSDSVVYATQINIAAVRPINGVDGDGELTRTVRNVIPFAVTFELEHEVTANVTVNSANVTVNAAITDLSVVTVMPDDDPYATAELIFVTATLEPYILEALDVNVNVGTLSSGLRIEELIDQRQCDVDAEFCRQFWKISINPQQCTLNGEFTAEFQGVCHPDAAAADCVAPSDDEVEVIMTTRSDDFCGITQEIGIHGDITLQSPSPCNGQLQGSVVCFSPSGAPLNSTSIVQLRASPTADNGGFTTVYDLDPVEFIRFNYESTPQGVDTVNFAFDWLASEMRCQTVATVEVVVRVEYQATRDLSLLESSLVTYRMSHVGDNEYMLLQVDDDETDVNSLQIAQQLIVSAASTDNTGGGDGSGGANGGDGVDDSSDGGSGGDTLPTWVLVIIILLALALCCLVVGGGLGYMWYKRREDARKADVEARPTAAEMTAQESASDGESSAASSVSDDAEDVDEPEVAPKELEAAAV